MHLQVHGEWLGHEACFVRWDCAADSPSVHWEGDCGLVGRTLDLESAYKQATSHPEDRWCRSIVVWNPVEKTPAFFLASALMFGSTAAVYAFNRLSKSLWHLQTCILSIMGTVYFDDFPMLEFQATSASARECSENLLELLGWQFAEGRKALPFDNVFTVFGINMDLPQSRAGRVPSGNKPDRVQSLLAAGSGLCTKGRVERGDAASLHGELNFARGQYIGSESKPVMSLVSSIATDGWHDPRKEELTIAAAYMLRVLAHAEWKLVDIGDELRPVLVFSDGAWEPGATKSGGAGLALIDPVAGARVVHHVVIPPKLLEFWTASGKKQVITELELWPVVVGVQNLASFLHRRKVLWFIDNIAVKDMLVKGSANLFAMISEALHPAGL